MNFATRALLPLLSITLNDGAEGGGSGGGDGGEADGGSSGDGKGAESSKAEGDKPPPAADDAAAKAKGDEAAKKAAADTAKAGAELAKSYESWKPTLPKDMPFDEKGFGDFRKAFIEAGLKPEQAQKLVDTFAGAELGRLKQIAEGLKAERLEWDKTVRADKELAGEDGKQLEQTAATARKAMQKFATPALRQLLKSSGLEAHPEMLRLMAKVGKGLAEDTTDGAREGGGKKTQSPKERLKARYPNSPDLHTDS